MKVWVYQCGCCHAAAIVRFDKEADSPATISMRCRRDGLAFPEEGCCPGMMKKCPGTIELNDDTIRSFNIENIPPDITAYPVAYTCIPAEWYHPRASDLVGYELVFYHQHPGALFVRDWQS